MNSREVGYDPSAEEMVFVQKDITSLRKQHFYQNTRATIHINWNRSHNVGSFRNKTLTNTLCVFALLLHRRQWLNSNQAPACLSAREELLPVLTCLLFQHRNHSPSSCDSLRYQRRVPAFEGQLSCVFLLFGSFRVTSDLNLREV